uniref:GIY-YIG domain-containing protein n=1 Tax=viral metagenome TaxID=1070528 RepID=A0A6C0AZ68_9ZZZZ
MGYIYLITNKLDGKQYIGQTIRKDINKRWNDYRNLAKKQIGSYFYNALKKYNPINFKFQIICICFDEDCNKYEEYYIKNMNTLVPYGYNLRLGGKNGKQHPESIEKRRIANTGKKRSEEHIFRAEKSPNFGKILSEEQKRKISSSYTKERKKLQSIIMKERYKNSILIKRNIQGLQKGLEKLRKKVNCYNLDNELINSYESLSEASRKTGAMHQAISKCCSGKYKNYKSAGGFIWKYANEN